MKKQMKVFSLLGWMILCCFGLYAQNIKMTRIPSVPQLPVSALHRIFQDSEGYIWYGTVNGLCRDDGYQIKVFRSDFETPNLLNDNTVQCIAEADDGRIWFGTDHGAYILDKKDTVSYLWIQRIFRLLSLCQFGIRMDLCGYQKQGCF